MNRLKFIDCSSKDKVKDTLNRIYGLRPSDYVITDFDEKYEVEINVPDKNIDSKILVTFDQGAFRGFISCYPAINEGYMLTMEEIKQYVTDEGVVVSINEQTLKDCYDDYRLGNVVESRLIAQGSIPVDGKNAEIIVHFEMADSRPKMVDGKIDYKNVDNIVVVSKGDILLTKRPATIGVRGMNIRREEIVPVPGKDVTILLGDGATVDNSGTTFTATLDGYVDYNGKKLTVSPVYNIAGNVDYSTGNIKFNGSVHIKGDVLPGFRVEADKHILVDGICQDCELLAKENVILRTGIKGSVGGVIMAGDSVILGYCEKSRIQARGNIEIKKYAFNCELMAGNRIDATNGDGIVAGGRLQAFQEISVKQLGTQGNCVFSVYVGSKYYIEKELEGIKKEKVKISETLMSVEMALMRFDLNNEKIKIHPKIQKTLEIKQGLDKLMQELNAREEGLISENVPRNPRVKIKGKVFEGITVHVFESVVTVKERLENVVFFYDAKFKDTAWVSLKNINEIETHDK